MFDPEDNDLSDFEEFISHLFDNEPIDQDSPMTDQAATHKVDNDPLVMRHYQDSVLDSEELSTKVSFLALLMGGTPPGDIVNRLGSQLVTTASLAILTGQIDKTESAVYTFLVSRFSDRVPEGMLGEVASVTIQHYDGYHPMSPDQTWLDWYYGYQDQWRFSHDV